MEIGSKLSTVVAPTHEVSLAALVTVMSTAVKRSIAISLSQATGLLGSTAPPTVVVPSTASLAWDSLSTSHTESEGHYLVEAPVWLTETPRE